MNKIILSVLLSLMTTTAWALGDDQKQPIYIEADQVDIDEPSGVSTYTGAVKLTQGSMELEADNIVVYTQTRKIQRIIATGKPAHFQQQPEADKEHVEAHAQRVEFSANSGMILLTQNAELKQGPNTFSGDKIEYDTRQNMVRAQTEETSSKRVQVIIHPESLEQQKNE